MMRLKKELKNNDSHYINLIKKSSIILDNKETLEKLKRDA